MILLSNLTKRFGPKVLFENVTMQFDPGKRYGLTGANGAGKSTLIKMLAGEEESDTGSIDIPKSLRLGVLKQNHFAYDQERLLDAVMMGNKALWAALQEKDRLLAGEVTDEIGLRLGELEGTISEENGYVAESDAAELLVGLGIPTDKHEDKMNSLPAGYKLRVLIAQVLFGRPDVLLLDEPTNHLDLDSIRWLERFLTEEYKGTLVVVSHDRHFLNAVVTHIADVDYQTITVYTGSYDDFVDAKYENRSKAEAQNASAKKKIADLQQFVDRFGAHASKSKQAQSRVKQIEKLEVKELKRSSLVRPFVRFEIDKPSGRDVLRMEGVDKAFGKGKDRKVIFKGLGLNLNRGDKMAVIGPNGIGKSTLLKLMVGAAPDLDPDTKKETLDPDAGEIRWGHETSVGYFAQDHHEALGETSAGMNAFQWLYQFDKQAPPGDDPRHPRAAPLLGRGGAEADRGAVGGRVRAAAPGQAAPLQAQRARHGRADEPPGHRVDRGAPRRAQAVHGHGRRGQPRPPLRRRPGDAGGRAPAGRGEGLRRDLRGVPGARGEGLHAEVGKNAGVVAVTWLER